MTNIWRRVETFFSVEVNRVVGISILGLALRFIQLGADLWEKHSWRHADGEMIASNFYLNGFDILHPQINWAGNLPGYVGTEFPLVPFLTSLLYLLFGEHLVIGRLVSVGFFVSSIGFFYLLVRKYFGQQTAWFALFFYLVSPLCVFYTRKLMPESALLFFSIGSIYLFSSFMDNDRSRDYFLSVVFTAMALLVKIPIAVLFLPLAYLAFAKYGWRLIREKRLWMFILIVCIPSILWYSHAFSIAASNYPFHMFGEGAWIWDGGHKALVDLRVYVKIIVVMTAGLLTPVGMLMAIGGAIVLHKKGPGSSLFELWGVGHLVFLFVGLKAYMGHEYYQLPLLPVVATFAGGFCNFMVEASEMRWGWGRLFSRKVMVVGLVVTILLPSLAFLNIRYVSQPDELLYFAGKRVEAVTPKDALIAAWDGGSPILLYASDRHGWHFPEHRRFKEPISYLEEIRRKGAEYFVAPRRPGRNEGESFFLKSVEYNVRRMVLGISKTSENTFIGYLRLFDPKSSFGIYLEGRYAKIVDDQVAVIYDLRSVKVD